MLDVLVVWSLLGSTLLLMFLATLHTGAKVGTGHMEHECWACGAEKPSTHVNGHAICLECHSELFVDI